MLGQNLFCRRSTGTLSTMPNYTYVLRTLRCNERVSSVQAAAATSVSSPMDEERRTNSARPRIASCRAAAACLARSSTRIVDAPSSTKLLRRSIMAGAAGAPVERGVNGSELAAESMISTNSIRWSWLDEFEACALAAGWNTFAATGSF